jgi:hypothetical protein
MSVMEQVYAQPHEGITGTERSGDPLLTEDGSLVAIELMGMLHKAVLVGNPAPIVAQMYDRIASPAAGDAVVVFDAIYSRNDDHKYKGVGYLIAQRAEWAQTDAKWAEARSEDGSLTDDDRWIERDAWYIQYGPDAVDVCRWSNCRVLAIPRTHSSGSGSTEGNE